MFHYYIPLIGISGVCLGEEWKSAEKRKDQLDWKTAALNREEQGRGEPRNTAAENIKDTGGYHKDTQNEEKNFKCSASGWVQYFKSNQYYHHL